MASEREVSPFLDGGLQQKSKPEELCNLLLQVSEDLAFDASQHCPHLWIQNRSLESLY